MPSIVAVRSWRGGTGKSTVVCRLGFLLAGRGLRVGVVDASLQAPGLHEAIGVDESQLRRGLSDYLVGDCEIEDVHYDASHLLPEVAGRLYLVPATTDAENIAVPAFGRYDPGLLHDGFHQLTSVLQLDVLLVDTHAGVNYEAVYAIAAADIDLVVARSAVSELRSIRLAAVLGAQICRRESLLVLNMAPGWQDADALRSSIEAQCGVRVAAVVPHVADLVVPGSATEPATRAFVAAYRELADRVLAVAGPPANR